MNDAAPGFVARPATASDAEPLARLAAAVADLPLLVRYAVDATRLGQELGQAAASGDASQVLLVVETVSRTDELCGFARVQLSGQFGRGGYLKLIALRPGHEGRGIGRILLDAVERAVAERAPDLFLLTSDFNDGAQRFYSRAGYARVGELPDFVRPGITEIIYWKRLRRT